jgi:AP-1 complex subunit gamma-1
LNLLQTLIKKHEVSHSLELQLRACEYDALVNATKGIKTIVAKPSAEADLFGVTDNSGGGGGVSASVVNAAKEALSRMPVVDLKVLEKKREAMMNDVHMSAPKAPAASASSSGGDLLDLSDMFGGGAPAPAEAQIGSGAAEAPKSDLDLLTDIFAASAAPAALSGGYDPFGGVLQPTSVAAPSNPLDIFGASPANMTAPVPALSTPLDIFGAPPVQTPAAPLATPAATPADPMMMGAPALASSSGDAGSVLVPAFTHEGLTIEFECTKPDIWNKQSSVLIAKCRNASPDAMYGFNLQCAVPKYVTMEMEPPSSTTIPVTGMNNSKIVTQKIKVTNSQLGTKNLMLKLKVSFTLQGRKIEHMATCGGFPSGEY